MSRETVIKRRILAVVLWLNAGAVIAYGIVRVHALIEIGRLFGDYAPIRQDFFFVIGACIAGSALATLAGFVAWRSTRRDA